ncbi:hypothetical protein C1637_11100 [Chryseobacterium lactis]|uniref:DUF1648 domain-containing protein n=1 Tax=Chryseobacterium lactis TaxID=1241981 RepID=A0A3G6RVK0_CHRLC|nr:DUF1648 domain-containing protein [Chryseobacterium lactis]AZA80913.1 DUF1648 domain-containing protein [Chryseobacterium lactis]AZB05914.1 DUF1648 domain-containing protein [Chryseobacterium lactis]PNW13366.1 hypothetical protein C1637_11100 [Chryseobacterium lactis]
MKLTGILLTVNTLLLIAIWIFTGIKYADLPDIIPTHFDFQGKIDGQSGKAMIWALPCIATFISVLFVGISRDPDSPLLNVPKSFRNKDTLELYMFSMQFSLMILFLDIIIESVRIAEGKQLELSNAVFFILGLLFMIIGIGLVKSIQERIAKKSND